MKNLFTTTFSLVAYLCFLNPTIQVKAVDSPYGKPDDLPPGVPHVVDTNGNVFYVDPAFTTTAFQEEGLRLVIEEANRVARDLQLPETLPITSSNLTHSFIAPFGYTYVRKRLGNITTTNYSYNIGTDFKFSNLTVADYDDRCIEYCKKFQWPTARLDTNAPYPIATQWLAAVHVDVARLNLDCDVHVDVSPYWNDVELGEVPKENFTPIYCVWWSPKGSSAKTGGALVELFLPVQTLLQITVDNPKYVLRPPVVFTNLAALFPGTAEITTNKPSPPIYIDGSSFRR
jgi:hypothetical protein